jgi:geranylgeranyl diphosphate synthase, type II
MNLKQKIFLDHFEHFILSATDGIIDSTLKEAMRYAIKAKGKRFRPLLVFSLANQAEDHEGVLVLATAIELIHTYSLIHDDLPAMDDDDLRRGQPTLHKQFDEATAILTGDALLSFAFELLATSSLSNEVKVSAVKILSQASGANGMIYGQMLDMDGLQQQNIHDLLNCYQKKTGELFAASLSLGNLLSDTRVEHHDLLRIGQMMGIVFQIQDDYLEAVTDTTVLGKSNQSDTKNMKQTYVQVVGLDESLHTIIQLYEKLNHAIIELPILTDHLIDLVEQMRKRMY